MGRTAAIDREGQQNIQSLRPDYRAMARAVAIGATNAELCERFDRCPARISIIVNSPLFRAEVARLQDGLELTMKDAAMELQEMQGRALEVIAQDLNNDKATPARTRVAFEVLDRTGLHKKVEQTSGDKNVVVIYNIPRPGDDAQAAVEGIAAIPQQEDGEWD